MDPYRTPDPPPPEPIFITCDSSLYVVKADILFRCNGCKAEWCLSSDVFNLGDAAENAAFHHLQLAWSYKHQLCR